MDQIANMLSTIKNSAMVQKTTIVVDHSNQKENIAKVLKEGGFLKEVKVFKEKDASYKKLKLELASDANNQISITSLKRVSRPGRRLYVNYQDIKTVSANKGFYVISTSRGIMNSIEAKKKKLGGELICQVY